MRLEECGTGDVRLRGIRASAVARNARADAFAAKVGPLARQLRDQGKSLRTIAAELNWRGIKTSQGAKWVAPAVLRVLAREAHLRKALAQR